MRRVVAGLVAAVAAACLLLVNPASAGQAPYPVNYDFLENSALYGALPQAPGSNIWTCKPSKTHPNPVVLVHGTAGSAGGNWGTISAVLANQGYCVFALTYGVAPELRSLPVAIGGMNKMEDSAAELKVFVDKVRAATGAKKVDIVGHSQGTVVPDYYAKFLGGGQYIDKYVSLSPVWHGDGGNSTLGQLETLGAAYKFDPSAVIPVAKVGPEFAPDGPFYTKLRAGGVAVPGIRYTNIVTRYDDVVIPYTSGIEPGMTNIVLQDVCANDFSDHVQIPSSPNVARLVLNALDPAHAQRVACRLVLPLNGFESTGNFVPELIATYGQSAPAK